MKTAVFSTKPYDAKFLVAANASVAHERIIQDDVLQRLVTFPNVIISSHQAYFTDTALQNISNTTVANLTAFENGEALANQVTLAMLH
jgi:lactate dehydrogenase-like 2-hydroxyacid dehydrogenase